MNQTDSDRMRDYPRSEIEASLTELSPSARAVFAALAAQRLIPYYRSFAVQAGWGDVDALERALVTVWNCIGDTLPLNREDPELRAALLACEAATPDTDEFNTPLASRALDAANAVAIALESCTNPAPEVVVEAGEIAWEAAFGAEQAKLIEDVSVVRLADADELMAASRGEGVRAEESVQRALLERLRGAQFTPGGVADLRETFGERAHARFAKSQDTNPSRPRD